MTDDHPITQAFKVSLLAEYLRVDAEIKAAQKFIKTWVPRHAALHRCVVVYNMLTEIREPKATDQP